jgi:hypothetical protein
MGNAATFYSVLVEVEKISGSDCVAGQVHSS